VWFQSLQNHPIHHFDLPIGPWVADGGPVYPDVVVITKAEELLASEVLSVVGDDGVRDSEIVDDFGEEIDDLF
jgi:hypothetical protein